VSELEFNVPFQHKPREMVWKCRPHETMRLSALVAS